MYSTLGILVMGIGLVASSRDTSKAFRSMPAISNSLVNLGKMDISFHFNARTPDSQLGNQKPELYTHSASPFFVSRPDPTTQQTVEVERSFEPCPCSSFKNFRNPFISNSPSDMLGKILKSNDLFSYNQEPAISTTCCDSHEHVQEDTVFLDFSPKSHAEIPIQPQMSALPLMLDALLPKMQSPATANGKPKAIEIFFFPKNKEGFMDLNKLSPMKDKKAKKNEIQIVGDKELKNEFKSLKYRPSYTIFPKKEEKHKDREENKEKKSENKVNEKHDEKVETANGEAREKTTPGPFTPSPPAILI